MKLASSEAKNSTALATSSGFATRRNGMALISPSRTLSGSEIEQRGVGRSRANTVDVDLMAGHLARERLGEGDHPALGAGVHRLPRTAHASRVAGNVDDLCRAFRCEDGFEEGMGEARTGPRKLTATNVCHSVSSLDMNGSTRSKPAALTMTAGVPCAATTSSRSCAHGLRRRPDRSRARWLARSPSPSGRDLPRCGRRAATVAPPSASAIAMARPIPDAAPVTTATLLSNRTVNLPICGDVDATAATGRRAIEINHSVGN